jgi:hypothetical protein
MSEPVTIPDDAFWSSSSVQTGNGQVEEDKPALSVYFEFPGGRRVEATAELRHVGEGVYEGIVEDQPELPAGARLSMVWETDKAGIRLIFQVVEGGRIHGAEKEEG